MAIDRVPSNSPWQRTGSTLSPGIRWVGVPLLLLALAAVSLTVDLPVARFFTGRRLPSDVRDVFNTMEAFGHGVGALCIVGVVCVLDRRRRSKIFTLVAAAIGSGLAANVIKLVVSRQRPCALESATNGVLGTFGDPFPLLSGGSAWQSFPSAHAATAVGLAVALGVCYPHGRWLFAVLAGLAAFSRVAVGAHFLSDIFVGAAVAWLVAHQCMRSVAREPTNLQQADSRYRLPYRETDNLAA